MTNNILDYGADPNGVTDSRSALNAAISDNSSDTIYIPKGVYLIGQNITILSNKKLIFDRNARLKPAAGIGMEINGTWDANPDDHIFDLSIGGSITGNCKIDEIYPEWFGAKGDGVADDLIPIKTAINLAVNSKKITLDGGYALTIPVILQPKRYRVTDTIYITKSANAITSMTGRATQLLIKGSGISSSIELDKQNGTLLDMWNTSVCFKDVGLWAVKGGATVMKLGKNDPVNLYELRQSRFVNVFFRGNVNLEVERIFDSSFYDCFFAISGDSGVAINLTKPTIDNHNNVNLRRCHFEVSANNCTWIKARGDSVRTDGYHHGFNFDGCHFETRSYTTTILDLDTVNSFAFYRCQMTQNGRSDGSDTVSSAVSLIKLNNVAGISFDTCGISRQNDVSTAPLLVKASGVCNAVTFRNVISATCGDKTGGRKNFIDDSQCTTKRGIRLDNCMLTTFGNKSSNDERLYLSAGSNNRDWQLFDDTSRANRNLMVGYTSNSAVDLIPFADAPFGFSSAGQFFSKFGYSGLTTNVANGSTYSYALPGEINANKRGIYMFALDTNTGLEWGIVVSTGSNLVTMILGSNVENGGNVEPNVTGKLNIWCGANGTINFKNLYGSNRDLVVIPFTFGKVFT
ncbi:Pectate lyase superfamily protein [Paenibacillus uliginis N3/975]|uniref:Pectate lyase superfamily protein n=1 Tax=Paenibacillus uliginis N3/975 TaxID=1313296 RepID=A0A1X7HKC1_9BACL|nr:glycosyl hydrolase family 28-related protein [Paenibacillus uliginis]SMF88183.1 Pectate lyase superfamily protein [Paenibacillus uliginis N3/975]